MSVTPTDKSSEQSTLPELQLERKIGRKALITGGVILVAAVVFAIIGFSIGGDRSMKALHEVSDLFVKTLSSPGFFLVGAVFCATIATAIHIYRLVNGGKKEEHGELLDVSTENQELRRFLRNLLISVVVLGVIAVVATFATPGGQGAMSKMDQPVALVPGFVTAGALIGLGAWVVWMDRKEQVDVNPFEGTENTERLTETRVHPVLPPSADPRLSTNDQRVANLRKKEASAVQDLRDEIAAMLTKNPAGKSTKSRSTK